MESASHFALDISVIQSFLERKREVNSSDNDECTSDEDNYDYESTSTSGSGSKRDKYSYHIGCPSICRVKRKLVSTGAR